MNSSKLKEIFGTQYSLDPLDCMVYSSDASQIKGSAKAIVWPTGPEQIQKLVHYAVRTKLGLVARGAGTGCAGGAVPQDSIVVDMSRMNRIIDIDPDNHLVSVEPGVVAADLNDRLDEYNMFFPIIPASHTTCQIGGMIATDASGTRAVKYGRMSDWVRQLMIIDGTGKILTLKREEDIKDFCGTEGILGIVIQAKLGITEQIKHSTLSIKTFDDVDKLVAQLDLYKASPAITAIEYFNRTAAELSGLEHKYYLFAEFEDDSGDMKDPLRVEKLWSLRKGLGPALASCSYVVPEDPKIPHENISKFIRWLDNHKVPAFGHIATGIFHPRFKPNQERLIKEMFKEVRRLKGSVSGEHGIGLAKKKFFFEENKEAIQKLKDLKAKYDPEGILNRGKIYD